MTDSACPRCHTTEPPKRGRCPACGAVRSELEAEPTRVRTTNDDLAREKTGLFIPTSAEHRFEVKSSWSGGLGVLQHVLDHRYCRNRTPGGTCEPRNCLDRALKRPHAEFAVDPLFVSQFIRSALRMLDRGRRSHEAIPVVYEVGPHEGPYVLIEWLSGNSLEHSLRENGPWPLGRVLDLGQGLLEALQYVHGSYRGEELVHGDIKPANLVADAAGKFKLIDWDFARPADSLPEVFGASVDYMAPEQADRITTPRSDLYSLAKTLYQCLTGDVPTRPNLSVDAIPRDLRPILEKALQLEPDHRYANAAEMRLDWIEARREIENRSAVGARGRRCPVCNAAISFDHNACPGCGAPQQVTCPACKAANAPEEQHCRGCGRHIRSELVRHVQAIQRQLSAAIANLHWRPVPALVEDLERWDRDGRTVAQAREEAIDLVRALIARGNFAAADEGLSKLPLLGIDTALTREISTDLDQARSRSIVAQLEQRLGAALKERHAVDAGAALYELDDVDPDATARWREPVAELLVTAALGRRHYADARRALDVVRGLAGDFRRTWEARIETEKAIRSLDWVAALAAARAGDLGAGAHGCAIGQAALSAIEDALADSKWHEAQTGFQILAALDLSSTELAELERKATEMRSTAERRQLVRIRHEFQTLMARARFDEALERAREVERLEGGTAAQSLEAQVASARASYEAAIASAEAALAGRDLTRAIDEAQAAVRICPEAPAAGRVRSVASNDQTRAWTLLGSVAEHEARADFVSAHDVVERVGQVWATMPELEGVRDRHNALRTRYETAMAAAAQREESGMFPMALDAYREAQRFCPMASVPTESITRLAAHEPTARERLTAAGTALRGGHFDEARIALDEARRLWPILEGLEPATHDLQTTETGYRAAIADAKAAEAQRQLTEALAAVNRALGWCPDDRDAHARIDHIQKLLREAAKQAEARAAASPPPPPPSRSWNPFRRS